MLELLQVFVYLFLANLAILLSPYVSLPIEDLILPVLIWCFKIVLKQLSKRLRIGFNCAGFEEEQNIVDRRLQVRPPIQ
jgi:hypothetical protein